MAGHLGGKHALNEEAMREVERQGGQIIVGGRQDDLSDALAAQPLFNNASNWVAAPEP